MHELIKQLNQLFPQLKFKAGSQFSWSPESGEIIYKTQTNDDSAKWSLLHETGHALLKHTDYQADIELLNLEVAAWQKAQELAQELRIVITENHIQDCLDTYRDWLYRRSICPDCGTKCLQQGDFVHYRCFNCHKVWRVSGSRFCRAYRRQKNIPQPTFTEVA